MLSTVKYYIMAGLGFLVVVFYALLQSERLSTAQDKLKRAKSTRQTEKRVNKATLEGLQRERDSKNNRNYDDDSIV